MYHTFRIQLALDIVAASAAPQDVEPLIRAVPNVTTVPRAMHVQWFVHQEEQFAGFLPDFPDCEFLVWEVLFKGPSPFRDPAWRCTLKTSALDFRHPLVHSADAEPIRVEHRGRFEYDIGLAGEGDGDRTISLQQAVLIVR